MLPLQVISILLLTILSSKVGGQDKDVQFPYASELLTHVIYGSGNVSQFPKLTEDLSLHSHHSLVVSFHQKSFTRYVNYHRGNLYFLTNSSKQSINATFATQINADASEGFELYGLATLPAEPKPFAFANCGIETCNLTLDAERQSHPNVDREWITKYFQDASKINPWKYEVFNPQEWTSAPTSAEESMSLMLVNLNRRPTERVATKELNYRRISVESGKTGKQDEVSGSIRFERIVVPIAMAQLKRNSNIAAGSKGSLLVIDKHSLGYVKFNFIEEFGLVTNGSSNDMVAVKSPRGVRILNHVTAPFLADGSLGLPDNGSKDHCFSFRPQAALVKDDKLEIYEGNYITELSLEREPGQRDRSLRIPTTFTSPAHLGDDYWDAIVDTLNSGVCKFTSNKVFVNGVLKNKLSEVFPGLPDDTAGIDAAWLSRNNGFLYIFIGERYWTFNFESFEDKVGWRPKTVAGDTQRDLTPFMRPSLDAIMSLPVFDVASRNVFRRTYFFANGYYFSILDDSGTKSETIDPKMTLRFALTDKEYGGFAKVSDWCGPRYGIQNFNVADHVKKIAAFHENWNPYLPPSELPDEDDANKKSGSSSSIVVFVFLGIIFGLVFLTFGFLAFNYVRYRGLCGNYGPYHGRFSAGSTNTQTRSKTVTNTTYTHTM